MDTLVKIIAETPDYVVLEKPAGMLSHAAPGVEHAGVPVLVDWLLAQYPEMRDLGEAGREGLVQRLDKDVSGLMVVPRTEAMFHSLQEQFTARTVEKFYTALAHGTIVKDESEITFVIGRHASKARMAARPEGGEGREAKTRFWVLERRVGCTLVRVQILTGRTHQIRAHFHAYGFPLVGDALYAPRTPKLKKPLDRVFLHASELAFADLSGVQQRFTSPLPDSLEAYKNQLPLL